MLEPTLSIVTLSFNQGRFLRECLESVLNQGVTELEYTVVDPGSADSSRRLLESFADRIDKLILEPDEGPADGLNKAFASSTGEVLGYINADDRFAPGALAYVKRFFAARSDVDVLCGSIRIIDESGAVSPRARTPDKFDLADYAAGICTVGQQATFFRRAAFDRAGGFNIDNRSCWDGELLVDLALAEANFATTKKVLGDFRIYGTSLTGGGIFRSDRYRADHERINAKIASSGAVLYSPLEQRIRRFAYKANMARHLGYLLAR
jgi:glycosyltransferase involved in cell wall biosynthesis